MKVLVTGSEGYIGKEIMKRLEANSYQAIGFDLKLGQDLRFNPPMSKIFKDDIKTVIHLAAYKSNPDSIQYPWDYYHNNVLSTLNLLSCMNKGDRLIFSSTAAVYGKPNLINGMVKESDICKPETPYARSKLMCEEIIQDVCLRQGIDYVILRYFNVAGGNNPESLSLIPSILRSIKNGTVFNVYGDGKAIRDYIDVRDVAIAHLKAIETNYVNDIYNIGSSRAYSVNEVIEACKKVTGYLVNVNYTSKRRGDVEAIYANIEKAIKYLKLEPYSNLEAMIRSELGNIK